MISAKPMIALSGVLISWTSSRSESGSASRSLGGARPQRRGRLLAQRNPAIAGEAPVGRLERRNSADLPFARHRPVAGDGERGVAERRAHREGAHDLLVDAIAVAVLRPGDRAADQRPARRALDPGDLAAGPAFPAEQRRRALRGSPRPSAGAGLRARGCGGGARSARRLRAATGRAGGLGCGAARRLRARPARPGSRSGRRLGARP